MNEKSELAEAMGANLAYLKDETDILYQWPDGRQTKQFDPFTDANDDYAVLEWIRAMPDYANRWEFWEELQIAEVTEQTYYIGDYARAALKVIK